MAKKEIGKQQAEKGRIRLGLCCIFRNEPIRFRVATAKYLMRFNRIEQLQKLSGLCLQNTHNLQAALKFLQYNGIGAFRISSSFFPRFTHPEVGYSLADLPDAGSIIHNLRLVKKFRQLHNIRQCWQNMSVRMSSISMAAELIMTRKQRCRDSGRISNFCPRQ